MKLQEDLDLIRSGEGRHALWQTTRERFHSHAEGIGVRRDLRVPFPTPPAKIAVDVRPLRPGDDLALIADAPGLSPAEAQLRADQRWILSAGIPTCWVAVDADGEVCFMTFLIAPADNARVQEWWRGELPVLQPDEALIEGSYAAESHRALGILSHAACRISEQAGELGARYVLSFMSKDNIGAQKAAKKAGFTPYLERRDTWKLFHRNIRFAPLGDVEHR